ncbi:hypothetical protein ES703_67396 [subsurface metagenome]
MIRAAEVVFLLTMEDVKTCAKEMGIPQKALTDDVFYKVRKGVESAWEGWPEVVKAALAEALRS